MTRINNPASDPEVRKTGIGGSDAAAILDLNPWKTPLDVYSEKRGLVEPEEYVGEAAEWGTILEPVLLSELAQRDGVTIIGRDRFGLLAEFKPDGTVDPFHDEAPFTIQQLLGTLRHPEVKHMMCHLDGVIVGRNRKPLACVEAKTSSAFLASKWGEEGSDEVPDQYLIQCQHNLCIVNAFLKASLPMYLPALIGGQRWKVFHLEYDPDLGQQLIELEGEFWQRVQEGDPPPASEGERGQKSLKSLYPRDEGEEMVVDGDEWQELAITLRKATEEKNGWLEREKTAKNRFMEKMGTTTKVIGPNWSVSWKNIKDSEKTDWESVAREAGASADLIATHTKVVPGYRRFTPSLKKLEA